MMNKAEGTCKKIVKRRISHMGFAAKKRTPIAYIYAIRYARDQEYGYTELRLIENTLLHDIISTNNQELICIHTDYYGGDVNGGSYFWKKNFKRDIEKGK